MCLRIFYKEKKLDNETMNLTDDQLDTLLQILKLCKNYNAFVFDDLIIEGNKVEILKKYVTSNPNKKLRTWLMDTQKTVTTNSSEKTRQTNE